jgi:hypothetical protein
LLAAAECLDHLATAGVGEGMKHGVEAVLRIVNHLVKCLGDLLGLQEIFVGEGA